MLYSPELTLDLFSCPACCIDCASGKFAVRTRFFDQSGNPIVFIPLGDLAVGKCVCKVAINAVLALIHPKHREDGLTQEHPLQREVSPRFGFGLVQSFGEVRK